MSTKITLKISNIRINLISENASGKKKNSKIITVLKFIKIKNRTNPNRNLIIRGKRKKKFIIIFVTSFL